MKLTKFTLSSKRVNWQFLLLIAFFLSYSCINAQTTPPNANSDAECGGDCWDIFDWSPAQDAAGNNISNYGEGLASDANCTTSIGAEVEYVGSDPNGIDLNGNFIGANMQGSSPWTDEWTLSFDAPLSNPVIRITDLFGDSDVCITDCDGTPISLTDISSGNAFASGCFMGNDEVQLSGTFNCFIVTVSNDRNDRYDFSVGTCLSSTPLPPCVDCGPNETYNYLTLVNASGSGTGATADVLLDGVLYGDAEVIYSDVSINEDLSGSRFGAIDQDGGIFLLQVNLCSPITVQQVDVIGLETESQVWVGTSLSGTGSAGIPSGLTLTQCDGSATMAPSGNMVTNTNAVSCNNQGNGNYTVGSISTSTLYFRYTNPVGGCVRDRTSFRIGACVPEAVDVVPTCPMTEVTLTNDPDGYATAVAGGGSGSAFTFTLTQDANGNYFNQDCGQIQDEVNNGTAVPVANISPCAEVIEEELCSYCDPVPPCTTCSTNETYEYLTLANASGTGTGATADVLLDGVLYGDAEVLFSNVSIRQDLNGSAFGAVARGSAMEESFIIQVNLCEPLTVQQVDIIGLETESQVWVGTGISGTGSTATPTGLTLTQCDGDATLVEAGNMVTNNASGCLNQSDGNYTIGAPTVSTLYFRYTNPAGGCRIDKTTFRIGVCTPELPMAIPECSISLVESSVTLSDGSVVTDKFLQDGLGNYFAANSCPTTLPTMAQQTATVSPCATIATLEQCPICIQPGLAKTISNITPAESGIAGNVDVTFKFTLANYGSSVMSNLIINDDIASLPGYIGITTTPMVTMTSAGGTAPTPNASYAGTGNLLNGTTGGLSNGQQTMVEVVVEFDASALGNTNTNSAQGGGTPPNGMPFPLDDSTPGTNPDPNGDGDPAEMGGTTLYLPSINAAKEITGFTPAASGVAGNIDAVFAIEICNTGNVELQNITLEDNLMTQLGSAFVGIVIEPSIATSNAATNPTLAMGYNGGSMPNFFNGTTGSLLVGQCLTIEFTAELDPNAGTLPISNQATTTGQGINPVTGAPLTGTVSDLSDSGSDPNGQNPNAPGDTGGSNDPTLISIPQIALAKNFVSFSEAASGTIGNVDVVLEFNIENTGTVDLSNLTLVDNLTGAFGSAYAGVVTPASITASTATTNPTLNSGFNGTGNNNLFNGITGLLEPNQTITIQLTIEMDPDALGSNLPDVNQATTGGDGVGPDGSVTTVTDLSDDGVSPESNNPGEPGDTGGSNDPSPFNIPQVHLTKDFVSIVHQSASGTAGNVDITIAYNIENTGNVNLSNIDLIDDLNAAFGSTLVAIVSDPNITASTATTDPTLNGDYTGTGDNNMFDGMSGVLEPNQILTIQIQLELDPNAAGAPDPIFNQASTNADGVGPDGNVTTVSDDSDSGADTETSNSGEPGDTGGHNDPTPIPLPAFNIAKHIAGVACAASETSGNFNVIYQVVVENTGNVDLTSFNLIDNMTYGSALVAIVEAPSVIPVGAYGTLTNVTTAPMANAGFTGDGDNLVSGDGLVQPGELFIIQYTLELNTAQLGLVESNQISGSANGLGPNGAGITISDLSDSGYIPESSNQDRPGDSGSHNDPTPLTDCWNDVSNGIGCNDLSNLSVDDNCMASIGADHIIEGYHDDCGGADLFPLGGYYVVELTDENGNIIADLDPSTPNTIEFSGVLYLGQTLTTKVTEVIAKNNCWGEMLVEDKIDPELTCPATQEFTCNDLDGILDGSITGIQATATDNCDGNVTITHVDLLTTDGGTCGTSVVTRTFTATDDYGNSVTCSAEMTFVPLDLANVIYPANADIDCSRNENEVYQNTNSADTYTFTTNAALVGTLVTGEPSGVGCNIQVSKEDHIVEICEGSYKVLRTWTAIDWCQSAPNNINTATQIIKVLDSTGPTIAPIANIDLSTSANGCASSTVLPAVMATDDCSNSGITYSYTSTSGTITLQNGVYSISGLGIGTHTVTAFAADGCGNESSITFEIISGDQFAPIAICDEFTKVGIGSDGLAAVPAITFDDGSTDNCGIIYMDVRRMTDACNTPPQLGWKDYAEFCCADIGTTVMVEFRVHDAAGNTNSCMVEVEVEDKLAPTIVCPPNKTINCDDDYTDLGLTGEAIGFDNCSTVTPTFIDNANINDCGEGSVVRIWSVTDDSGNSSSCVQFITLENADPFNIVDTECRTYPLNNLLPAVGPHSSQDDVEWPCDIDLTTCGLGLSPSDLETNYPLDARPQIYNDGCGTIGVAHDDLVLPIQGDACLKVLRTWTVIDWCQYDENNPTAGGRWEYVQIIKVLNSQDPNVVCDGSDAYIQNFEENCGATYVNLFATADDDCTPQADLEFSYVIENGNGTVIKTGNTTNASDAFNNGTYKITWTVTDGCGNHSECEHDFKVEDAKKPTPICLNGLATVIMPSSGMVEIWAVDFESGSSFDNCTPYSALEFSFSSDVNDKSKVFTCADITTSNQIAVEIWVTDGSGNQDFCTTYILVQDPNGACPPGSTSAIEPAGKIETAETLEVENVIVNLDGSIMTPIITTANGSFNFGSMVPTVGTPYIVRPEKNINPLNGVTTFDLVLISKHILGIASLDSPYKVIAADANNSSTVTTFDIVTLRRLILQIDTEFQGTQKSWRFVDANQVFANPMNPFPFTETIDFTTLPQGATADFVGVKIGDVNGSASPNQLLGTDTRNFEGDLVFSLENKEIKAGEEFTVDFNAKDFNNTLGYQFTLGFDNTKVTFVDMATSLTNLEEGNFGLTRLDEGVITTSWNSHKAVNVEEDGTVFSLTFTANEAITISEIFNINSRYTVAEAYNGSDLYNVSLAFNGEMATDDFKLYQNTPNPFKEVTSIGFNLPEATTATLKIYDVSGKVLRSMEVDGSKGYNEVKVNRTDLDGVGVLYYQVETSNHTATMKMILVD